MCVAKQQSSITSVLLGSSSITTYSMQQEIAKIFGSNALGHAIFYSHPHGLRFELSESGAPSYIHMFLQAYQKAERIADFIFADAKNLHVALGFYSYAEDGFLANLEMFESIASCKLTVPEERSTWVVTSDEESADGRLRHLLVFEIDRRSIPQYLWGALATDIGIHPRLNGDIYLFDLELGILAHPYDDRGMDVIGTNLGILRSAYTKFDRYLLAFDRELMRSRFAL
jgi:hypothetical protein